MAVFLYKEVISTLTKAQERFSCSFFFLWLTLIVVGDAEAHSYLDTLISQFRVRIAELEQLGASGDASGALDESPRPSSQIEEPPVFSKPSPSESQLDYTVTTWEELSAPLSQPEEEHTLESHVSQLLEKEPHLDPVNVLSLATQLEAIGISPNNPSFIDVLREQLPAAPPTSQASSAPASPPADLFKNRNPSPPENQKNDVAPRRPSRRKMMGAAVLYPQSPLEFPTPPHSQPVSRPVPQEYDPSAPPPLPPYGLYSSSTDFTPYASHPPSVHTAPPRDFTQSTSGPTNPYHPYHQSRPTNSYNRKISASSPPSSSLATSPHPHSSPAPSQYPLHTKAPSTQLVGIGVSTVSRSEKWQQPRWMEDEEVSQCTRKFIRHLPPLTVYQVRIAAKVSIFSSGGITVAPVVELYVDCIPPPPSYLSLC